jgi:hypothetical protein
MNIKPYPEATINLLAEILEHEPINIKCFAGEIAKGYKGIAIEGFSAEGGVYELSGILFGENEGYERFWLKRIDSRVIITLSAKSGHQLQVNVPN